MKISLKAGQLVQYRDGRVRKVFKMDNGETVITNVVDQGWNTVGRNYNSELKHEVDSDLDIVKIYNPKDFSYLTSLEVKDHSLFWEAPTIKKVHVTPKEIAEKFGTTVELLVIEE